MVGGANLELEYAMIRLKLSVPDAIAIWNQEIFGYKTVRLLCFWVLLFHFGVGARSPGLLKPKTTAKWFMGKELAMAIVQVLARIGSQVCQCRSHSFGFKPVFPQSVLLGLVSVVMV